eukprot:scaffold52091_cov31-Tisochrysis_lutea.AAC.1
MLRRRGQRQKAKPIAVAQRPDTNAKSEEPPEEETEEELYVDKELAPLVDQVLIRLDSGSPKVPPTPHMLSLLPAALSHEPWALLTGGSVARFY